MALSNASYVLDAELELYTNHRQWRQLCTTQDDVDGGTLPTAALSGTRAQRSFAALNFGRKWLDGMLQGVYGTPLDGTQAVSESWPPPQIKTWNALAGYAYLVQLHVDRRDEAANILMSLTKEIEPFVTPGGPSLGDLPRTLSPTFGIVYGDSVSGSQFDLAGQFPVSIIPEDQRGYYEKQRGF